MCRDLYDSSLVLYFCFSHLRHMFFPLPYPGDSTPLMEAASGGYADIVKLLIDHGANVNAKSRSV